MSTSDSPLLSQPVSPTQSSDIKRCRVASFPTRTAGNPSTELFYQALALHGIQLVGEFQCDARWLWKNRERLDAIHLHWPEKIWNGRTRGRLDRLWQRLTLRRIRGVLRLRRCLRLAGRLGLARLWTVHNIEPHEGADWVDRWGYRIVARHSDIQICYSHAAADQVRRRYPSQANVVAMHHGNYEGVYPSPRPRDDVRRQLKLNASLPVVSCVGIIRPYKGTEIALEAARRLAGRVQLVVAGQVHHSVDEAALQLEINAIPGAKLIPRLLSDQEFADLISASDAVLLPFRQITGSGSLMAAWSLGTGVVASDLPLLREMIDGATNASRLFPAGNAEACAEAIVQYLSIPEPVRREAAVSISRAHRWEECVQPVVAALRSLAADRAR